MWAVIASMLAVTGAVWAVISSMWAFTYYMYDLQALGGLLHTLTITLTIIKVQYRARNPKPTTVAATRRFSGGLRLL